MRPFFNLVLLIVFVLKWQNNQEGNIIIKSDFHGAKLEIGNVHSTDDMSISDNEDKAKEETQSISLSGKIIDLKKIKIGGQS